MNSIPPEMALWLQEIRQRIPEIRDIWFIGSRANGTERHGSDWDFLVTGNHGLFETIQNQPDLRRLDVDLLVSVDGNCFQTTWGPEKTINLTQVHWALTSPTTAMYKGTKWVASDEEEDVDAPYDLSTLGQLNVTNCVGYKLSDFT